MDVIGDAYVWIICIKGCVSCNPDGSIFGQPVIMQSRNRCNGR